MEWISVLGSTPVIDKPTKFLVNSSYGVTVAWYNGLSFQDCDSGNDEGMEDWDGIEFDVTHWMPIPCPPKDENTQ